MHELGIAGAVLRAVERRAAGRRVRRARVRAGALLHISGPALNQAFITVSDGTVADGAHLDVVIEPARIGCRSCGRTTTSRPDARHLPRLRRNPRGPAERRRARPGVRPVRRGGTEGRE